jgi:16S rRNA (guanine966-N2)-methyltransferase
MSRLSGCRAAPRYSVVTRQGLADPPYGKGLGETALRSALRGGWLLSGALCVVEEAASASFAPGDGFSILDERSYGDTVIRFIEAAGR